jgi:hypothetical protein
LAGGEAWADVVGLGDGFAGTVVAGAVVVVGRSGEVAAWLGGVARAACEVTVGSGLEALADDAEAGARVAFVREPPCALAPASAWWPDRGAVLDDPPVVGAEPTSAGVAGRADILVRPPPDDPGFAGADNESTTINRINAPAPPQTRMIHRRSRRRSLSACALAGTARAEGEIDLSA